MDLRAADGVWGTWDLFDAAAVVCFDAGVLGLAGWLRGLLGPAAGRWISLAVRPALVLPALIFISRRWWRADRSALGVARPRAGSWAWSLRFAMLVGLGYLLLGGALVGIFHGSVDVAALAMDSRKWLASVGIVAWSLRAMVVAPLVEELVFRGILYPALRRRLGRGWAVPVSAAVFAGMHPLWAPPPFLPVTQFLGGLVFAWSYERTRSLVHPMIFHAVGNAAILSWHLLLAHRPGWVEAVLG